MLTYMKRSQGAWKRTAWFITCILHQILLLWGLIHAGQGHGKNKKCI